MPVQPASFLKKRVFARSTFIKNTHCSGWVTLTVWPNWSCARIMFTHSPFSNMHIYPYIMRISEYVVFVTFLWLPSAARRSYVHLQITSRGKKSRLMVLVIAVFLQMLAKLHVAMWWIVLWIWVSADLMVSEMSRWIINLGIIFFWNAADASRFVYSSTSAPLR